MRILTYSVMFYMSLALIWWTILLSKNNAELFAVKAAHLDKNKPEYVEAYQSLKVFHDRKAKMILGEGFVFGCMLIIGLYVLQRMFNKELDAAQRQKNFLLSITHELKSPIASVNLITETLQKRELDKEKRHVLLDNILTESKRLEKLINNLLLSAKLQTAYQYNFESTELNDFVGHQIKRFRSLNPNLAIRFDRLGKIFYPIDREAFDSVLVNILENAVKYGGKNPVIDVTLTENEESVIFQCKDSGIGISKEDKVKIFEPFYRIGNEDTRKTKGTGLGLYIAGRIVKAHKGKIEISENLPSGSIFNVILPK
ncbi:MAG: HAMP domain-containing histidine kinase [Saprospiraceae bacterium]|nr:HAMP domain-containing histidine kinase [Saprospiraceae bacterium]